MIEKENMDPDTTKIRRKGLAQRIRETGNGGQPTTDEYVLPGVPPPLRQPGDETLQSTRPRNPRYTAEQTNPSKGSNSSQGVDHSATLTNYSPAPSPRKRGKTSGNSSLTRAIVSRGSNYAEIHRMRERIVSTLKEQDQSSIVVTSPHDDAGNTFLISLLGYNAASYSALNVLLIDMNMRRPQLHLPFGLEQEGGFAEIAKGSLDWRDAVKETKLPRLRIITSGKPDSDLYLFLNRDFLENLLYDIREDFDLIMIDTSPVLIQNRNNVDPVLLSLICDMVLIMVQDKKTSKSKLENAVSVIAQGGGLIHGVIYNLQFHKSLPALLKRK